MKKKVGIVVVVVVLGVLIAPLLWYGGFTVDTAQIKTQMNISTGIFSTDDARPLGNVDTMQLESVDKSVKKTNVYSYMTTKVTGKTNVEERTSSGDAVVNIHFTLNLTTPSDKSVVLDFDPKEMEGTGEKVVTVKLGPDELQREKGTFHLQITIKISINPPAGPSLGPMELTPVSLTFTVPKE